MKVTIEYAAQVKRAAGTASEGVEVEPPCTVQQLVSRVAENHGDPLKSLLLDSNGQLHPSILLFVGDDQIRWKTAVELSDRDVVTILSPISGG